MESREIQRQQDHPDLRARRPDRRPRRRRGRQDPTHHGDYFALGNSEEDRLRKLETLVVLSLKSSYLSKFVDSVQEEVPPATTFTIRVNPAVFKLDGGEEVTFDEIRDRLPIFNFGASRRRLKRVVLNNGKLEYEYLENGEAVGGQVEAYRIPRLDYRTDKDEEAVDVAENFRDNVHRLSRFMDRSGLARHLRQRAAAAKILLLARGGDGTIRTPEAGDLLALVGSLHYRGDPSRPTDSETWASSIS